LIELRQVCPGSDEYAAELQLRREVLRWPLGLDFTEEDLANEADDIHLVAIYEREIVACLVLTRVSDEAIKMRQVAVTPSMQGSGIGRLVVRESERVAAGRGYSRMELHARETAVPFYLSMKYEVEGEPFVEVSIPHRAMVKTLPPFHI